VDKKPFLKSRDLFKETVRIEDPNRPVGSFIFWAKQVLEKRN
jgi:hypothetical protein